MQAPKSANRWSFRKLLVCGLLLILAGMALLALATVATGQVAEGTSPSPSGALTPLAQFCLIAVWTAYVLAVFFRRPRTNDSAEA